MWDTAVAGAHIERARATPPDLKYRIKHIKFGKNSDSIMYMTMVKCTKTIRNASIWALKPVRCFKIGGQVRRHVGNLLGTGSDGRLILFTF